MAEFNEADEDVLRDFVRYQRPQVTKTVDGALAKQSSFPLIITIDCTHILKPIMASPRRDTLVSTALGRIVKAHFKRHYPTLELIEAAVLDYRLVDDSDRIGANTVIVVNEIPQ